MRWSSPTQPLTLLRAVSNWVLGIEKGNSTISQGNKTTKIFFLHLIPSCPVVGSH